MIRPLFIFAAGCAASLVASAQNLVLNGSFESGVTSPAPWAVSGTGTWENVGRTNGRCVSVLGEAQAVRSWFAPLPLETNQSYWVRFWAKGSNSISGYCFGGLRGAARDFSRPNERWTDFAYAAWQPADSAPEFRLSSWDGAGPVYFDDAEVLPLNAVYRRAGDYALGEGESLGAGRYTFSTAFSSFGGNCSRAIHRANTSYNTYRWVFNTGSEVIYRHELIGQPFTNASVYCVIQNYFNLTSTSLLIEAGTDGFTWQPVGALTVAVSGSFALPAGLQPATNLFIRLRSTNASQFALVAYTFAADVPDTTNTLTGDTFYFGKLHPAAGAQVVDVQNTLTGRVANLLLPNPAASNRTFTCTATTTAGTVTRERSQNTTVAAGATNAVAVNLPTAGLGDNTVALTVRDAATLEVLFSQVHRFSVHMLADDSYGESLPAPAECPTWTCSGSYKVGRTRGVPLPTNSAVQLAIARNEYEPFQLVLRPVNTLSNVMVSIGNFVSLTNPAVTIAATNVTVDRVEYVALSELDPANYTSALGDHPDPLPPLTAPFTAPAGTNSPLWFTVWVPKDAPGGVYAATITVQHAGGSFTVPVRLRVFDFSLTEVSHTRTAYGISPPDLWHGFQWATPQQVAQVWELYMQNMARHRASPYYPHFYAPIQYAMNPATEEFTLDYAAFDAAMDRYLEEYNFNSFREVNFRAALPVIDGVEQYNAARTSITPEYQRVYPKLMQPVLQHLRERGWLGIAYAQWIDEPTAEQIPLVRQGMRMIEDMAPDHPRMLATLYGPAPELFDDVNLWVPHWDFGMQFQYLEPRRAAGDELWYYVCTSPKDPWPNNLIDQPGINPRIRQWYAEDMQFAGEDYWGLNSYVGMTNPWTQTMCIAGTTNTGTFRLGNGDGYLLYPPTRQPPTNSVIIAGPVNSIRYENSRDGYEDREYFWLARRALAAREPVLGTNHPAVVEARAALAAALDILVWPPPYPNEPHLLEAARLRLGSAIGALDDGAPFIAKEPLSKVVVAGGSQTLRVEVAGWPLPAVQWQFNGTNLPGATGPRLTLSNLTVALAGEYHALASNAFGIATSGVARLTVLTSNQPPLFIAQPRSLSRAFGARAVFGGGVSSLAPLAYQWLKNGVPVAGATNVTLTLSNLNATHAGFYSLVAANFTGSVTSAPAQLLIQAPPGSTAPAITTQPASQTLAAGQNLQLTVAATGTAPLNYQWQMNGTNVVTGGNTATLTLSNVQPAQAGAYQVWIANVAGFATSAVATVTVQTFTPFIASQPTNQTVAENQHAPFSVTAGGTAPLAYQWFFNQTNALPGATASQLLLTNVTPAQAGSYAVRVTNAFGSVTSAPALLQLTGMPAYTTEPPGLAVERQGGSILLSLSPDNRSRRILVSTNLTDWAESFVATPSAAQVRVTVATTNTPRRFFRAQVIP